MIQFQRSLPKGQGLLEEKERYLTKPDIGKEAPDAIHCWKIDVSSVLNVLFQRQGHKAHVAKCLLDALHAPLAEGLKFAMGN